MTIVPVLLAAGAAAVAVGLPPPARLGTPKPPVLAPQRLWPLLLLPLVLALGPVGAAVAAALGLLGARARHRLLADRHLGRVRASAVEALDVLGAELRAGRPPAEALELAAPLALDPLGAVLMSAATGERVGAPAAVTLARSASTSGAPELVRGLAACWQVCSATGSSLGSAVDQLAAALRAEQEQRQVVAAELAGPRASAGLLALLPLLGLALGAGLGAHPLHVLLHTPAGAVCLLAGTGLDLLGLWWTGRLVAAAARIR